MTVLRVFLLALLWPAFLAAQSFDDVIEAELRPGWRMADGTHMAALHLTLAPGWKTYWRSPGEGGIPPVFDWSAAQNVARVAVRFPTPQVFHQSGMRSIGYDGQVVLPLQVTPRRSGQDVSLRGVVDLGICKEICMPHQIEIEAVLPKAKARPDPTIAAALASVPLTAREAGIGTVRCRVTPISGGLRLQAEIPVEGRGWATVVETASTAVWATEPRTVSYGSILITETDLHHISGGAFALDRSSLRFTVLRAGMAIDIQGCKG